MKYIRQISTGVSVFREAPHTDNTISNAVIIKKIPLSDLEVINESLTEDEWTTKYLDDEPWSLKMHRTDSGMSRAREDHIKDVLDGVAQDASEQVRYDNKVALRATKP